MMDDRELADKVVALGVGKANQIYPDALGRFYQVDLDADWQTSVNEKKFVRDWRVAGALMDKCAEATLDWWYHGDGSGISVCLWGLPNSDIEERGRSEDSLPRAIIEACIAALAPCRPSR